MGDPDLYRLLSKIADSGATPESRVAAIRKAAEDSSEEVLWALLEVASDEAADRRVSRAAGESLARIVIRLGALGPREYELIPFHALTGAAAESYDETITQYQHRVSRTA